MKRLTGHPNLFDNAAEASSDAPVVSATGEGGPAPTPPLQPKQLRLEVIARATARRIWTENHYLHRDLPNPSLELGVFSPDMTELVGAICFASCLGPGQSNTMWEIRRMWLSDDRCARNSESRVLRVACRVWVKRIAPHVRQILSHSDLIKSGHKGIIYRAAGFTYMGMTAVSQKWRGWATHDSHKQADNWQKKRWILWLK